MNTNATSSAAAIARVTSVVVDPQPSLAALVRP